MIIESFVKWLLTLVVINTNSVVSLRTGQGKGSEDFGENDDEHIPYAVSNYLSTFGYLPSGGAANLQSEEAVRGAIRELQDFAGINVTGRVDAATQQLLKTKRCGLPDRIKNNNHAFESSSAQHSNGNSGFSNRIENWTNNLGPGRVRRIIHESFKLWSDVSALQFREIRDHQNADIRIKFVRRDHGDGYSFDGPNVVLAHAFFPGSGIGGDAHFDDDETWTDRPVTGYSTEVNLYSVAAHEFGHSLGLSHSDVPHSLMYPYYRHTMRKKKLPYDDTLAIQTLYGRGGHPAPVEPERYDPTPAWVTTTRATTTTTTTMPSTTTLGPPEPCDSHIQAISRIRNEIFVFKGRYFWRFDREGYLVEGASEISGFWYGFPKNLTHIDAVYERRTKRGDEIVFFSGDQYWVFRENRVRYGYPKPISSLGIDPAVKHIDGAFIWAYNGKTYLFSADKYWRFNELKNKVEMDYPRSMSVWKGVPTYPDDVFTDHHDKTYFINGDSVYQFSSYFMAVDKRFPVAINKFWSHCSGQKFPQPVTSSGNSRHPSPIQISSILITIFLASSTAAALVFSTGTISLLTRI